MPENHEACFELNFRDIPFIPKLLTFEPDGSMCLESEAGDHLPVGGTLEHQHAIDDITGLQDVLADKAALVHQHKEYALVTHPHAEYALQAHEHPEYVNNDCINPRGEWSASVTNYENMSSESGVPGRKSSSATALRLCSNRKKCTQPLCSRCPGYSRQKSLPDWCPM